MKCIKAPAAETELTDAAALYDAQRPGLGDRFIAEFERVAALLVDNPALGTRVGGNLRTICLNRFPFCLIYRLKDSEIRIIAIAHQKRRPHYWRTRVEESKPYYVVLPAAA